MISSFRQAWNQENKCDCYDEFDKIKIISKIIGWFVRSVWVLRRKKSLKVVFLQPFIMNPFLNLYEIKNEFETLQHIDQYSSQKITRKSSEKQQKNRNFRNKENLKIKIIQECNFSSICRRTSLSTHELIWCDPYK